MKKLLLDVALSVIARLSSKDDNLTPGAPIAKSLEIVQEVSLKQRPLSTGTGRYSADVREGHR